MTQNQLILDIKENWKLEAKQEDNHRLFYFIEETEKILKGERFYVIGRKGTGKSAIAEYITKLEDHSIFSEKLSFKQFPFNELYSLDNKKYTPPNQYITIWKYIIYSFICRMMIRNQSIDSEIRSKLSKLYEPDPIKSLSRIISKWTATEFGVGILGSEIKVGGERKDEFNLGSWEERTNLLEDIIEGYIDDSKYYVIFDELDEDYRIFESASELKHYEYLITSLFKAVQDIKGIFRNKSKSICPIIFLRDDIYNLIRDTDKNKWSDFICELEWDIDIIKNMLAYRISKSIDIQSNILPFQVAWDKIFVREFVYMGTSNYKRATIFDYMARSTQLRPRDFVRYIQVCAHKTADDGYNLINARTVKLTDKAFSNYLRNEIIDEIHAVLPDIENIFTIISQIRKWNFTINEFSRTYNEYLRKGTVKEKNLDYVLHTLFQFSVIGTQPRNRKDITFFKYLNKEARFNFQENIVVHRGLFKALQII